MSAVAVDVTKAREEAEKEIRQERAAKAKTLIKAKLIQIDDARKVLSNLEEELNDLQADIVHRV